VLLFRKCKRRRRGQGVLMRWQGMDAEGSERKREREMEREDWMSGLQQQEKEERAKEEEKWGEEDGRDPMPKETRTRTTKASE
jgi:hypothetical protein